MGEFKREGRYVVLKLKDIAMLSEEHKIKLNELCARLNVIRAERGATKAIECVVVEHDWPEYEYVWGLIKHRMEMGNGPIHD